MDKTFAAIEKLKEIELELHRLKNALEMMNRAHEVKKEWVGLTDEEKLIVNQMWNMVGVDGSIKAIEAKLKEKNSA
jgi:hypothetical protein